MKMLDRYLAKPSSKKTIDGIIIILGGIIFLLIGVGIVVMMLSAQIPVKPQTPVISVPFQPIQQPLTTHTPITVVPASPEPSFIAIEEIVEADIPLAEIVPLRYGFTDEEVYLLTQLLCGDYRTHGDGEYDFDWWVQSGRGINDTRQYQIRLVLNVVMNRVRSDIFPDTVTDVVLQKGQFTVFPKNNDAIPCPLALEIVREWCEMYDAWDEDAQVIPENHLFFRAGPNLTNVSRGGY